MSPVADTPARPSSAMDLAELQRRVRAEKQRRHWLRDPVAFITDRLGEHVWSKQREIAEAVRDHRRVSVRSCHESGKSFIVSRIAAWWLETHLPGEAFVVTSAPTAPQVRAILWREINRAHAKGRLIGRVNQTEWWLPTTSGANEEIVGFGRKPSEYDPSAFQGIHARYVLVILDEACGIPKSLWDAADTLIANEGSRIVAIGNPDDPATEFADVSKPGSGWHTIRIDAFDTPNFTKESIPDELRELLIGTTWVEEKRRKWGEASPLWISKVRGEFPEISEDSLIPVSWVRAAQARELEPGEPNELGVDVARFGNDKTVIAHRRGAWVRIRVVAVKQDTMATSGHVVEAFRESGATLAKIDDVGVGGGVVDRLHELKLPVVGVNVGQAPTTDEDDPASVREGREAKKRFLNLRAELWWALRERFMDGAIDIEPNDDDLAAELCAVKYKLDSRGRIVIESKDDLKKRGHPSPDHADAVMLAFAPGHVEPAVVLW